MPGDNTAYKAFEGLASQLAKVRIPLVIDTPEYLDRGALAVVGIGFYQSGFAAAEQLARVLAGDKPGQIPIRDVADKKVLLNRTVAAKLGITFPPAVLAMETAASTPTPPSAPAPPAAPLPQPLTRRWRIQQV